MILITGASRGIGSYLFAKYMNTELVFGTYNLTNLKNSNANFNKVDINNYSEIEKWIENAGGYFKQITLINCAGINYNSFAHKSNIESWHKVIDVNLKGTFNVISAILPVMRKQNFGRIINLSSILAHKGVMGTSAYSASKAGLNGMIKSIALENATKGITINNLNLGYFDIGMIKEIPEHIKLKIKDEIPCKKFGNPENIFNAIEFLRKSDYVNGTSINVNGGLV